MTTQQSIEKACNECGFVITRNNKWSTKQWLNKKFCSSVCQRKGRFKTSTKGRTYPKMHKPPKKCSECSQVSKDVFFSRKYKRLICDKHYWHLVLHGKILWADIRPLRTTKEKRQRGLLAMIKWRKAVFDRDDYTCQICKERGGKLNADHIKPFKYFPELRYDINNGRTLCVPCHRKTDTYGRRVDKLYGQKTSN